MLNLHIVDVGMSSAWGFYNFLLGIISLKKGLQVFFLCKSLFYDLGYQGFWLTF